MTKTALERKIKKEDIGNWTGGWSVFTVILGILMIVTIFGITVQRTYMKQDETDVKHYRMPDVRMLSFEEAKNILVEKGYVVERREDISFVIPEGYIMAQTINPGEVLDKGETITLTVSVGANMMPDVKEFLVEDAKTLLEFMEIAYVIEEEEITDVAPGTVFAQSVAPNERVEEDGVRLTVATTLQQESAGEMVQVGNYVGRLYEDVKQELQEQGVYIAKCGWEYYDDLPTGSIVSQRVLEGQEIGRGEVLAVSVNVGFSQAIVPDTTGKTVEEALQLLRACGMLAELTYENSTEVPADSIIKQDIIEEEKTVGTYISLCVSLGKKKEIIDWTTDSSLANSSKYTCETKTEYRYQTRSKNIETTTSTSSSMAGWTMTSSYQSQGEWGAWSGWSESPVSGSDTRQVESREMIKHGNSYDYIITEYRYRDRTVQTTYTFTRDAYSEWSTWSEWQQEAVVADDCTNVETRTLYKYTEK